MSKKKSEVSPAVLEAKKQKEAGDDDVTVLDSGVRVRVKQVPPGLLQDILSHLDEPVPPMWYDEDKGREEPNPNHPEYIKAVKEYQEAQSSATIDAIALFGLELVDGLPEDRSWVNKLKIMSRRNDFDLSQYDLEDEVDLTFLYTRFIALAGSDYIKLGQTLSGITEEDVEAAQDMFQGNEGRATNRGGTS